MLVRVIAVLGWPVTEVVTVVEATVGVMMGTVCGGDREGGSGQLMENPETKMGMEVVGQGTSE